MNFISIQFIFFYFSLLLIIIFLQKKCKINLINFIIFSYSIYFIGYADIRFLIIVIITILLGFIIGLKIQKNRKKVYLIFAIIISVSILGYCKYYNFFANSFSQIFGTERHIINILLPLGISFFTFSNISYLVDVYNKKIKADTNLLNYALYITFFPKYISGPIVKYSEFSNQLKDRKINKEDFLIGLQIFIFGMGKKIVLADRLSVFVNEVYSMPFAFSTFTVWFGVISYSLQIYFDFSGYSDMAIGLSRMLGFKLPRNFNIPYISHNVSEFWKRWHISLSSWLMEYLYIPMGGSRTRNWKIYRNLMMTMIIGGLWHGASWTFVIWGMMHGFMLCLHRLYIVIRKEKDYFIHNIILRDGFCIFGTYFFVVISWIFFRADSFEVSKLIFNRLFIYQEGVNQPYLWSFVSIIVFILGLIVANINTKNGNNVLPKNLQKKNSTQISGEYLILDLSRFWNQVIFFTYSGLIICLAFTGASPFIYGKF